MILHQKWKNLVSCIHLSLTWIKCLQSTYLLGGQHWLRKILKQFLPIKGSSDKCTITATFPISLQGDFLPMQLIYGGKIRKYVPRFKFPEKFSLSYNGTHYSNEKEACTFIEEILQPYIKKVIEQENLPFDQKSLVIMDVFKGIKLY